MCLKAKSQGCFQSKNLMCNAATQSSEQRFLAGIGSVLTLKRDRESAMEIIGEPVFLPL